MDSLKGFARRVTQSTKEKFGADATNDARILEVNKKLASFQKSGTMISNNVTRLGRCFDELGRVLTDLGTEYRNLQPVDGSEMYKLMEETCAMGAEVTDKAKEFNTVLKENGFDPITQFLRDMPKMKVAEEEQKKTQLEFDFFRNKVMDLRRTTQKDPTRVPRNEGILEKWRVDLHNATEKTKAVASELHAQGQKANDLALYSVSQTLGNYSAYLSASTKQHFMSAQLPMYSTLPILAPLDLPVSPFGVSAMPAPGQQQPGQFQGQPGQQGQYQQQQGQFQGQQQQGQFQQGQQQQGQFQQGGQQQQGQFQQGGQQQQSGQFQGGQQQQGQFSPQGQQQQSGQHSPNQGNGSFQQGGSPQGHMQQGQQQGGQQQGQQQYDPNQQQQQQVPQQQQFQPQQQQHDPNQQQQQFQQAPQSPTQQQQQQQHQPIQHQEQQQAPVHNGSGAAPSLGDQFAGQAPPPAAHDPNAPQ